ncbi:MAG: hypothetical protein HKN91_03045 [Acidimicrobiia bacterium]|nr:hypothetical protein [Acidimicrobiia bacterium]
MHRKLIIPLLAFALVVAACTTSANGPTTTSSTTTPLVPTTTSPTTSTTSTTSTTAPTTTGASAAFNEDAAVYRVVGVAGDDVLNVRSGPGIANEIVAMYGHDYEAVLTTGNGWTTPNGSDWVEVTDAQFKGWVNKRFLEMINQTRVPLGEFPCSVGPDDQGSTPDAWPAPAGSSNADNVFDVEHITAGGCARTVITLGTGFDWEDLDAATPADRVSAMVTAVDNRSAVPHVLIDTYDVFRALPGTAGRPGAFIVRKTSGPADEIGQNGLLANVPTGPGAHNVFYLADPARIVVDHWFVPVGNSQPSWAGGTGVILIEPVDAIPGTDSLVNGTTFAGYSRGFEANVVAVVKDAASGRPVVATWEPALGGSPIASDLYVMTVNDWTEAWGQFSFSLWDLDPGSYILEMATDDASGEDDHETLKFEFTITS